MTDWKQAKVWSDRFLPEIKQIIGPLMLVEAPLEEDMKHNTDLMVLTAGHTRVACRVRTARYFPRYADEFTIRSGTKSGMRTELAKIIEGWGDLFFYGFSNVTETGFQAYVVIDLKKFRSWHARQLVANQGVLPGVGLTNLDGTSFRVFKVSDLPPVAIVKQFVGETK